MLNTGDKLSLFDLKIAYSYCHYNLWGYYLGRKAGNKGRQL